MFRFTLIILSAIVFASCTSKGPSKNEKTALIHYTHGTEALINKDYTTALDHLLKALKYDPKDPKIYTNAGMAYYFKNQEAKAIEFLRKSIEMDPKNSDAKLNLANIYMKQKRYQESEKLYQEVLKDLVYKSQFRTYQNLGSLHVEMGNYDQAIYYTQNAIKENSQYCPAYYQLGAIYYKIKNWEKARESFDEATKGVCFNHPQGHFFHGMTMMKLKLFDLARNKFQLVTEKFEKSPFNTRALIELRKIDKIERNREISVKSNELLAPEL